jgi:hypothetical protein
MPLRGCPASDTWLERPGRVTATSPHMASPSPKAAPPPRRADRIGRARPFRAVLDHGTCTQPASRRLWLRQHGALPPEPTGPPATPGTIPRPEAPPLTSAPQAPHQCFPSRPLGPTLCFPSRPPAPHQCFPSRPLGPTLCFPSRPPAPHQCFRAVRQPQPVLPEPSPAPHPGQRRAPPPTAGHAGGPGGRPPGKALRANGEPSKEGEHRATPGGYGGKPPGVAIIGVPTGARNAGRGAPTGDQSTDMNATRKLPLVCQDPITTDLVPRLNSRMSGADQLPSLPGPWGR